MLAETSKRVLFRANAGIAIARLTFAAAPGGASAEPTLTIGTLKGYPIVWGALSDDRGGYKVRLMPGSANFQVPTVALRDHDFGRPLGNTESKTLRILPADDYGLPVEIDLPATSDGRDVAVLFARGDVRGMSFSMVNGFEVSTVMIEDQQKILQVGKFTVDEISVLIDPSFAEAQLSSLTTPQAVGNNTADSGDGYGRVHSQSARLQQLRLDRLKF